MHNYSLMSIIGKYEEELGTGVPGSKYDSFEALLNDYLILLFYALSKNGIVYSTNRNGILARVQFVDGQFVNYVQPAIGKWDFKDERYQRIVSLDFVLYLFNETCMAQVYQELNYLAEPQDLSKLDYNSHDSFDLEDFSIEQIVNNYNMITHEQFLASKGLPNKLDSYSTKDIEEMLLLYSIMTKVIAYSEDFRKYQETKKEADMLRNSLKNREILYGDLTDKQSDLLEYYSEDADDESNKYFPCLGYFYNHIKQGIFHSLVKEIKEFEKVVPLGASFNGLELANKGIYYNPVRCFEDIEEGYVEIKITFDGAYEFDLYENRFTRERKNNYD